MGSLNSWLMLWLLTLYSTNTLNKNDFYCPKENQLKFYMNSKPKKWRNFLLKNRIKSWYSLSVLNTVVHAWLTKVAWLVMTNVSILISGLWWWLACPLWLQAQLFWPAQTQLPFVMTWKTWMTTKKSSRHPKKTHRNPKLLPSPFTVPLYLPFTKLPFPVRIMPHHEPQSVLGPVPNPQLSPMDMHPPHCCRLSLPRKEETWFNPILGKKIFGQNPLSYKPPYDFLLSLWLLGLIQSLLLQ